MTTVEARLRGGEWTLVHSVKGKTYTASSPVLGRARGRIVKLMERDGLDPYITLKMADQEIQNLVDCQTRLHKKAQKALEMSQQGVVRTAKALVAKGLSLRDVGVLLGYSHHYISVLVSKDTEL